LPDNLFFKHFGEEEYMDIFKGTSGEKEHWQTGKISVTDMIQRDPQSIKFYKTPSPRLQCAAVRCDPGAMGGITRPCEAAQLAVTTGPMPHGIQLAKQFAFSTQMSLATNPEHKHWVKIAHDCGIPVTRYALSVAAMGRPGLPARL
jgi:hypothetical protein